MKIFYICIVCSILYIIIIFCSIRNNNFNVNNIDPIDITDTIIDLDSITFSEEKIEEDSCSSYWRHDEQVDEMRGTINTWDYIISDDIAIFDPPYDGGSSLRIDIRYMKESGTDVIMSICPGQFDGSEYYRTNYVTIKFDNEPLKRYYFDKACGSFDCIFLRKKSELIHKFEKSKKIMVEASFFREGIRQFTFTINEPYKRK